MEGCWVLCLSVCLLISKISQKVGRDLADMWWTKLTVQRSLYLHLVRSQIWDVCHPEQFLEIVIKYYVMFVRKFSRLSLAE